MVLRIVFLPSSRGPPPCIQPQTNGGNAPSHFSFATFPRLRCSSSVAKDQLPGLLGYGMLICTPLRADSTKCWPLPRLSRLAYFVRRRRFKVSQRGPRPVVPISDKRRVLRKQLASCVRDDKSSSLCFLRGNVNKYCF